MSSRDVAEQYAAGRGFRFEPKGSFARRTPSERPVALNLVTGPLGGGPTGTLGQIPGTYGTPVPGVFAHYEVPGLGRALTGMTALRSGSSIWTRARLPKQYAELDFDDAEFTSRFRVGILAAADEQAVRRVLTPRLRSVLVTIASADAKIGTAGTVETAGDALFLRGLLNAYRGAEELDGFAAKAAQVATAFHTLARMAGIDRSAYGRFADRIETELRRTGLWETSQPGELTSPFGEADRTFAQWLRYDLVRFLRSVAAGELDPPAESNVGAKAVREFDGVATDALIEVLVELDRQVRADAGPR